MPDDIKEIAADTASSLALPLWGVSFHRRMMESDVCIRVHSKHGVWAEFFIDEADSRKVTADDAEEVRVVLSEVKTTTALANTLQAWALDRLWRLSYNEDGTLKIRYRYTQLEPETQASDDTEQEFEETEEELQEQEAEMYADGSLEDVLTQEGDRAEHPVLETDPSFVLNAKLDRLIAMGTADKEKLGVYLTTIQNDLEAMSHTAKDHANAVAGIIRQLGL